jgi:hypothetical protein
MSEVDQYEYLKAIEPQGINLDSVYVSKQWNFTNDINNSIYTNSSLSLVQFNLSNLFSSSTLINLEECFLVIPTLTCVRLTNGNNAAAVAPANSAFAIASLKTNNACTIHSLDLMINGKTVSQLIPYSNLMYGFDMASQMSKDDLTLTGKIKGFSQQLDNPKSAYYTGNFGADSAQNLAYNHTYGGAGPGLVNNSCWGQAFNLNNGQVGTSEQLQGGIQNFATVNGAIQERINSTTFLGTTWNNFTASITTAQNLNTEFKPYVTIINNDIVYYDYLTIKLSDINGFMKNAHLVRKADMVLRLYINTGLITVQAAANGGYPLLNFNGLNYSTFTNTCPITINSLGIAANYSAAAFTDITAGFFIGRSPNYAITTLGAAAIGGAANPAVVNFGNNYSSQMPAVRFYYPNIILDPLKLADYLSSQQSKTVVNRQFLYNTYTNIEPGATFSQLIQSGIRNIKAVIIFPMIAQTVNKFSQFQSCFDPAGGCSFAPLSLINLSIQVGGIQVNNTALTYQYESWIEQLLLYNKSSSTELGVESGLVSKEWWDGNKVYLMNIRNTLDDALTPRNVVVSFQNNSNVVIDTYFYIVYEDEWILNCATGECNQKQ